jgi:hypothetical protein
LQSQINGDIHISKINFPLIKNWLNESANKWPVKIADEREPGEKGVYETGLVSNNEDSQYSSCLFLFLCI